MPMSEPLPPEPKDEAAPRPEDGPQDFDLTDPDDQAREVDEQIEQEHS
jgi:hypothetical protein